MIPVDLPGFTVATVYGSCVAEIKDPSTKARHTAVHATIVAAEANYIAAAQSGTLYAYPRASSVRLGISVVTAAEMSALYSGKLVPRRSAARQYYDKIMLAPSNGICPYCGQRLVSALDHFLPKSVYPDLAVAPANLVAICQDCNKSKLDTAPASAGEQFIHPYFEDVSQDLWLSAQVEKSRPIAIKYAVAPPPSWQPSTVDRVRHQFQQLGLARLYGAHAAEELQNIKGSVHDLAAVAGSAGVKAHLTRQGNSYARRRKNSWQAAMYVALAADTQYCAGSLL